MEVTINSTFWTGDYIMESKIRSHDGATICAFNKGYNNDGYIAPTSKWIPPTIKTLNENYCTDFPLNNNATA